MEARKKDIAEALGALAVVASLVFVGLQFHLDRKVALADQYFNRGESAKADQVIARAATHQGYRFYV